MTGVGGRSTLRHRGDNANRGLETKSENVGLSPSLTRICELAVFQITSGEKQRDKMR